MNRGSYWWVTAGAAVAAAFGFVAGRYSNTAITTSTVTTDARGLTAPTVTSSPATQGNEDVLDWSKVQITNIAELSLVRGCEFVQSTPKDVLRKWAKDLENLPNTAQNRIAIAAFYRILAQVDTKTAVDLALDTASRDARFIATSAIHAVAPPSGYPELARLLTARRSGKYSLTDLILEWSRFDPSRTGEFVRDNLDKVDSNQLSLLLHNWATNDPVPAKEWLEQLNPDRRKSDVYQGLVEGWLESDRDGALQYL